MWKTTLLLAAALQLPAVEVHSTRSPVDKSYRKMLQGMDRFERDHALAPQASLRFRLLPRQPGMPLQGITLKVVGDTSSMPVPIAADHSFTLARNEQLWREDAALLANRKTLTMTWRAEVRSPGVPEGMRRLGDLRLECLVGMTAGLVSNNARLFAWLGELLATPDRVCHAPDGNYLFFTERPLFAVHLHAGARHATLSWRSLYAGGLTPDSELPYCDCQVLLDRSYYAPIWDATWPDDTLLSFEYMDDPVPPDAAGAPGIEAGQDRSAVQAKLGVGTEVRFLSGMFAWLYPPGPPSTEPRPHYWVLFDASGHVLKSRAVR